MRAKLTSRNRITLPMALLRQFPATAYFDVTAENGRIVLTPVPHGRVDAVRGRLAELGVAETDVTDAVAWARRVR